MKQPSLPDTRAQPWETVDWAAVEGRLRVGLPADYKFFVDRYGTAMLDDFLVVLNPAAKNPLLNLLERGERMLQALRDHRATTASLGKKLPYGVPHKNEGQYSHDQE